MTSSGGTAGNHFAVHHKTARVNDLDVFYREAGSQSCPGHPAFAWIPDFVQHVSESDSALGRIIPRYSP